MDLEKVLNMHINEIVDGLKWYFTQNENLKRDEDLQILNRF